VEVVVAVELVFHLSFLQVLGKVKFWSKMAIRAIGAKLFFHFLFRFEFKFQKKKNIFFKNKL